MAMYQHFFGLQREPFSIAPDPRFLFMSERHREALAHLLFGLQPGGGFVLLTGEVPAEPGRVVAPDERLPWPQTAALGVQHVIAMFGATVLAPLLMGLEVAMDLLQPRLAALAAERDFILMGDVNIAHQERDLKNWKSNQKNSGFLPDERAWMTRLFSEKL